LSLLPLQNLVAQENERARALLTDHQSLNGVLAAAVLLHVGAAIKHQWIDRDGVLSRMLP
jgi:cytochrome b561